MPALLDAAWWLFYRWLNKLFPICSCWNQSPGPQKKYCTSVCFIHCSCTDIPKIWQNVRRWLNPPARFWRLHLCWFPPHSCCHLHWCESFFYSFMHQIDCCLVFWLAALLPHALSISFFSISLSKNQRAGKNARSHLRVSGAWIAYMFLWFRWGTWRGGQRNFQGRNEWARRLCFSTWFQKAYLSVHIGCTKMAAALPLCA